MAQRIVHFDRPGLLDDTSFILSSNPLNPCRGSESQLHDTNSPFILMDITMWYRFSKVKSLRDTEQTLSIDDVSTGSIHVIVRFAIGKELRFTTRCYSTCPRILIGYNISRFWSMMHLHWTNKTWISRTYHAAAIVLSGWELISFYQILILV
jgi:hypothetical protein